jgi:hypothetical protein
MKHIPTQAKVIYGLSLAWILLMFGSLIWGYFNPFFWWENQQGIDYFALPRGFLNLMDGKSIFDTFNGTPYGPRATWYLAHPIFEITIVPFFAFFSPWTSYALFQVFSVGVLGYSAYILAKHVESHVQKAWIFFFMLVAFPVYWLLYVGNMHAPLVLSLTFLFSGILYLEKNEALAIRQIIIGLLISLFTKPLVIIMLPLFFLLKTTRKATFFALLAYGFVSLLCVVIPFINPQAVGLGKIIPLFFQHEYVKATLNVYNNQFQLNETMLDNSIHWLNLIAQSDFYWNFLQIFSLSAFTNSLVGKDLPPLLYKLPLLFAVLSSFMVLAFKKESILRTKAILFVIVALSLTLFLSYNTIWEYQFTSALPVIAYILYKRTWLNKTEWMVALCCGILLMLPTAYIFYGNVNNIQLSDFSIIRFNRTVPVFVLYVLFMYKTVQTFLLGLDEA